MEDSLEEIRWRAKAVSLVERAAAVGRPEDNGIDAGAVTEL